MAYNRKFIKREFFPREKFNRIFVPKPRILIFFIFSDNSEVLFSDDNKALKNSIF